MTPQCEHPVLLAIVRLRSTLPAIVLAATLVAASTSGVLRAQAIGAGALFPEPFVVEHHLVQRDGDGDVTFGASLTDSYGGNWIVSEREDGSRLVVDLASRELTEVHPAEATYWSLSFDRLSSLRARYLRTELGRDELQAARAARSRESAAPEPQSSTLTEPPALLVTETRAPTAPSDDLPKATGALVAAPGVRELQVTLRGRDDPSPLLRAWVDPRIRFGAAARQSIASFEASLETPQLPATAGDSAPAARVSTAALMAALRETAGGAFPVRTVRQLPAAPDRRPAGLLEDVVTRLEPLPGFPLELVRVPDGFRRVAHPLELVLATIDSEAGREAWLGHAPVPTGATAPGAEEAPP